MASPVRYVRFSNKLGESDGPLRRALVNNSIIQVAVSMGCVWKKDGDCFAGLNK